MAWTNYFLWWKVRRISCMLGVISEMDNYKLNFHGQVAWFGLAPMQNLCKRLHPTMIRLLMLQWPNWLRGPSRTLREMRRRTWLSGSSELCITIIQARPSLHSMIPFWLLSTVFGIHSLTFQCITILAFPAQQIFICPWLEGLCFIQYFKCLMPSRFSGSYNGYYFQNGQSKTSQRGPAGLQIWRELFFRDESKPKICNPKWTEFEASVCTMCLLVYGTFSRYKTV